MTRIAVVGPIALTLALGAVGCRGRESSTALPTPDSTSVARARAAATALGADLMGMLTRQLAQGGPRAALAVCADSAQARTRQHQAEDVYVRRVGTRVRNPLNTPDSVEAAVLTAFAAALDAGRVPADTLFVAPTGTGSAELRYLRPIRVQEPCLACHGPTAQLAPEVRTLLATRYPADQAVNYAVGDLRGAISVRVPLPPARTP